jgi:hypothetical protein
MVFTVRSTTLWQMVRDTVPSLYNSFGLIQSMLGSVHAPGFIEHIYQTIPNVNFSSEICAPLAKKLRVLQGTECRLEATGELLPVSSAPCLTWGNSMRSDCASKGAAYTLPGTPLHWPKSIPNLKTSRPKRYILLYGPKLRLIYHPTNRGKVTRLENSHL